MECTGPFKDLLKVLDSIFLDPFKDLLKVLDSIFLDMLNFLRPLTVLGMTLPLTLDSITGLSVLDRPLLDTLGLITRLTELIKARNDGSRHLQERS